MHFTAFAAIFALVCMVSSIDAGKLPVAKMTPQRSMMSHPSSNTNININKNKNENDNLLFSLLFSELIANMDSQNWGEDWCDSDDDDSCFWKMIGAGVRAKSPKAAQETEDEVVADIETDKPSLKKTSDDSKSLRSRPVSGSSNFNFNSNSNENSNFDYSSLFASIEQFLRNKNKKLAKDTLVKKE